MKILLKKTLLLLIAINIGNLSFSQEIIKNGDFELGIVPDEDAELPTYWYMGNSMRSCVGWFSASPCCFDNTSSNPDYVPLTSKYGSFSPTSGKRLIAITGTSFLSTGNDNGLDGLYGGNVLAPIESPLVGGCHYHIKFKVGPIKRGTWVVNPKHNKVEVVFFKDGVLNPCSGWVAYTTPSVNWSMNTMKLVEYDFIVPPNIAALGLNKIQLRIKPNILTNASKPEDVGGILGVRIDELSIERITSDIYTPTTNFNFSTYTYNTASGTTTYNSPWSGKNILINTELIVDRDLTINSSSNIKFGTNAKITVKSPYKLTIDHCILDGSCVMWDGIVVESGAKIEFTNNDLQDAVTAIKITGTSSEFIIHSNTFEASWTHIELNDCKTNGTSNAIYGNNFKHNLPLIDASLSTATGKGVFGIKVVNTQSTNEVTIGKTAASGGSKNIFENGYIGIYIYKSNVNIKYSEFNTDSKQSMSFGIKTTGNFKITNQIPNTTRPYRYSLKLSDEVAFSNVKTGINAEDNYNLEIFKSSFNSNNIGIKATRCNDAKLIIGSDDGSTRNTFTNCQTGILLFDNHTLESANLYFMASETRVSNCDFTNKPFGIGVVISEPFRSAETRICKKLDIRDNTFLNIGVGIKLSNITGVEKFEASWWKPNFMPKSVLSLDYDHLDRERVISNTFNFTNKLNPEYIGIKVENTRGFQFMDNGFSHIDPGNWQNKGIWLDNSSHSSIRNNTFVSGVGILASGTMLESNMLCNSFTGGATGIQLAWEYLRPNRTGLGIHHGRNGFSARHNFFNDMQSWGQDIELWNTEPSPHNRWVWAEGEPLPKAIQFKSSNNSRTNVAALMGTGTPYMQPTVTLEGPFECDPQLMVDENENDDFEDEDTAYSFPRYVSYWNYTYYWEKKYSDMDTLIGTRDTTIAEIINIEKNIDTGNYSIATTLLGAFSPRNDIETSYAYLLGVIIEMTDSTFAGLDSTQASNVNIIASQQTITGGMPVFIARAILFNELGIDYSTIDDDYYPTIKGKLTDSLACIPDSLQGIGIALVDANLNRIADVDIVYANTNGEFTFNPYVLNTLDSNTTVGFITWPATDISTLNPEFKPIHEWKDTIYKDINTTRVHSYLLSEEIIPGEASPGYNNDTVIVDPYAKIYSVTNAGDDFSVSEVGSWAKIFNGHLNTYDKAIGIMKHNNSSLFVVSNMIFAGRKGFEVWCMDSLGNIKWKKTQFDSIIEYEALEFDTTIQGGLRIFASVNDGLGGDPIGQWIEVNTCLSFMEKYALPFINNEEEQPFASSTPIDKPVSIKVIPNPSQGNFIIQLGNTGNNSIFELYNLQGVKINESSVKEGINKIQLPLITKGIYVGKVTDSKTKSQKIVRIVID